VNTTFARRASLLSLVVLVLAAALGCGTNAPSPSGQTPLERAVIASGHPDWAPVMFREGDVIIGVGPTLVQHIFDELHLKTQFPYVGPWDVVHEKARSGAVDVIVAAYKTTAREEYLAYCHSYTTDPVVLFVKKGTTFPFTKNADLVGKAGVGTVGDSYGQTFDDFIANTANLKFTRVQTTKEGFDLVASGQADYFIYSLYAGQDELTGESRTDVGVLPHVVTEEPFYLAVSKQSPYVSYIPNINRLIAKYKADGSIAAWLAKYNTQPFQTDNQTVVERKAVK